MEAKRYSPRLSKIPLPVLYLLTCLLWLLGLLSFSAGVEPLYRGPFVLTLHYVLSTGVIAMVAFLHVACAGCMLFVVVGVLSKSKEKPTRLRRWLGIILITALFWSLLQGINKISNDALLRHEVIDITRADEQVYYLAQVTSVSGQFRYAVYRCDSWGVICEFVVSFTDHVYSDNVVTVVSLPTGAGQTTFRLQPTHPE